LYPSHCTNSILTIINRIVGYKSKTGLYAFMDNKSGMQM